MTTEDEEQKAASPQDPFTVGNFQPEDAEGIVRLFQAVYGEGYPIRIFYDPAALAAANAEGRYHSIVARSPSGGVIGVTHLYRAAPSASLYEWGVGLVLKEYRNLGVNNRLADFLHNHFIPGNPLIEAVYGEAVCNHPYMQKSIEPMNYVEMAIEVALMPSETYTKERSAAGRVATLTGFRSYRPKPHRVFLPAAYEEVLRWSYAGLDDRRDFAAADRNPPADRVTGVEMTYFDFAGVARIAVRAGGTDFPARLDALEAEARGRGAIVFQVFLNLTESWVGAAVETLRQRGYFFGGALPRWFDGDGLLMQKLLCPPDFDGIVLVSERAKRLLAFIQEDHARAMGIS